MTTNWYDAAQLPKFAHPPVSETAIGVEFTPIAGMDGVKLVHLQDAWSSEYPDLSEVPGAPPSELNPPPGMLIQFGETPRRIWAAQPNTGLLLQSQNDRLILNWRGQFSASGYPGYDALISEYLLRWDQLQTSLAQMGLPSPMPHLGEFTYVNSVALDPGETLSDVLTLIAANSADIPGTDTFGAFQFLREVNDPSALFPAQIQVTGQPHQTPDGRVLVFNVTARVLTAGQPGEWRSGIDAAHALASHTFAAIITESKQQRWGRLQ